MTDMRRLLLVCLLLSPGVASAQVSAAVGVPPPDVQFDFSRARTDAQTAYAAADQARTDLAVRQLESARQPVLGRMGEQSAIARDRERTQETAQSAADSRARLEQQLRELDDWYATHARPH